MDFCSICSLFSRTSEKAHRNPEYVCKCNFELNSSKAICDSCGLFFKSSSHFYLCKCKDKPTKKKAVSKS